MSSEASPKYEPPQSPMGRTEITQTMRLAEAACLVGATALARKLALLRVREFFLREPPVWIVGMQPYVAPVPASKLAKGIVSPLTFADALTMVNRTYDDPLRGHRVQLAHLLMAVDTAARQQALEDEIYGPVEGK